MMIPDDIRNTVRRLLEYGDRDRMFEAVARALLAERASTEAKIQELLKDPVAVRLNWMRGGINADSIIAEERERCATVATNYGLLRKTAFGGPLEAKRAAAKDIASAIRSGEETR